MAPGDKRRNHSSVAQIPHTKTKLFLRNAAVPGGFERHSHVSRWRPDWLAGHVRLELRKVVAKYPFESSSQISGDPVEFRPQRLFAFELRR